MRTTKLLTRGNYGITADVGAEPLIQLAGATAIEAPSGTYFDQLKPFGQEGRQASNEQLAEAVWERTSELVGLPASRSRTPLNIPDPVDGLVAG
jgi:hypothetical protein